MSVILFIAETDTKISTKNAVELVKQKILTIKWKKKIGLADTMAKRARNKRGLSIPMHISNPYTHCRCLVSYTV